MSPLLPHSLDDAQQLWSRVLTRVASALISGALHPLPTTRHSLTERGVTYVVRELLRDTRKPAAGASAAAQDSPFLNCEPSLHIADVGTRYVALLNKFPVVEHHLLIVTREFEAQTSPLSPDDLGVLRWAMRPLESLGFYNSGPVAGASQSHKHLQVVPLPAADGAAIDVLLPASPPARPEPYTFPWPFLHAAVRWPAAYFMDCSDDDLHGHYRQLAQQLGVLDEPLRPHNVLLTHRCLLLVPRTRAEYHGIPVNAMAYAGGLLVKNETQLRQLQEIGVERVLASCAEEA